METITIYGTLVQADIIRRRESNTLLRADLYSPVTLRIGEREYHVHKRIEFYSNETIQSVILAEEMVLQTNKSEVRAPLDTELMFLSDGTLRMISAHITRMKPLHITIAPPAELILNEEGEIEEVHTRNGY